MFQVVSVTLFISFNNLLGQYNNNAFKDYNETYTKWIGYKNNQTRLFTCSKETVNGTKVGNRVLRIFLL